MAPALSKSSLGYHELVQLTEEEAHTLLGGLLTMSTTASIETLYLILDAGVGGGAAGGLGILLWRGWEAG